MKHLIRYLLSATRGAPVRVKILLTLEKKLLNTHQLAKKLKLDYKTVKHHITVLLKHRLIEKKGRYAGVYFLTPLMKEHLKEFKYMQKGGQSSKVWE